MDPKNIAILGGGSALVPVVVQIASWCKLQMSAEQAAEWIMVGYTLFHHAVVFIQNWRVENVKKSDTPAVIIPPAGVQ